MDTVIMTSRVAVLILVIGVFVAAWSGDQPNQVAMVDRPVKVLVGTREIDRRHRVHEVRRSQSDDFKSLVVIPQAVQTNRLISVPLPKGIPAGKYLVADQSGVTQIRVVTSTESRLSGQPDKSRDTNHYSIQVGQFRWHFIRLETGI